MSHSSRRLTELEAMITAAEANATLLTSVIERRTAAGRDATRLRELVQSTRSRMAELAASRKRLLKDEETE